MTPRNFCCSIREEYPEPRATPLSTLSRFNRVNSTARRRCERASERENGGGKVKERKGKEGAQGKGTSESFG